MRRFIVRRNGWAVSAGVKNDSQATLVISRRHRRHGTECGILLIPSRSKRAAQNAGPGLFASRFRPALPVSLRPGERWSGTFSGAGRLPEGDYVRIQLGSFGASGTLRPPISMQFEYITDHTSDFLRETERSPARAGVGVARASVRECHPTTVSGLEFAAQS